MSDLSLQLDGLIITILFLSVISRGSGRLLFGLVFLILIGIRLLLMYDIDFGKTLSMEDLKIQYPELYYKMYATDEEKIEYWGTKNEVEIIKLIKKAHKSDIRIMIEDNPNDVANIIIAIFWLICGFVFIYLLRSLGLL